jgi:hypothetical protein
LVSVACPTSRFCVAVDGTGNAFTFDGVTWSEPQHIDLNAGASPTVSCSTDRFCLAIEDDLAVIYH